VPHNVQDSDAMMKKAIKKCSTATTTTSKI